MESEERALWKVPVDVSGECESGSCVKGVWESLRRWKSVWYMRADWLQRESVQLFPPPITTTNSFKELVTHQPPVTSPPPPQKKTLKKYIRKRADFLELADPVLNKH